MSIRYCRRTTLFGLLMAALLVATACSSDDSADQASSATRDYTDVRGTVVAIPEHPDKIVTLGEGVLDSALALGLTPIGTTSARGQSGVPAYLGQQATSVPIVASSKGPNLQQILKAEPDLILVDDTTGARNSLAELSKIAPTVLVAKYADGWEAYFDKVADALNRQAQHQKVLDDINTQIAQTKALVAAKTPANRKLTASVVRWAADGPTIVGGNSMSSWVLTHVGLIRPDAQARIDSQNRSGDKVSLENLDLIDADYLFFGVLAGKQKAAEELAAAQKLPGFTSLNANRSGHIYAVDGVPWTSGSGPIGVKAVLTDTAAAVR